jgi:hypothetical protein
MRAIVIHPHRMADSLSVTMPQWLLTETGAVLGDSIDGWVPSSNLDLSAVIEIDVASFALSTGLSPEDEVTVLCSWQCTATHLRGCSVNPPLKIGDQLKQVALRMTIPAGWMDSGVLLKATICLHRRTATNSDPMVASQPGAILWHDHENGRHVSLGAGRFPLALVDFKTTGLGEAASSWRLVVDSQDIDAPFKRLARLYINSLNGRVVRALGENARGVESSLIRQLLQYDIEKELVMIGIREHARINASKKDEGTLAAVLHDLLQKRFPEQRADQLSSRMIDDPKGFETELQARLGFLQCGGQQ